MAAGRPVPGGHTGAVLEPRLQSPPAPPASAAVTRRAAVLGMPIEHSLSPVLHTAAYAALGLSGWHYGKHAVDEDGLPGFVAGLGPEWVGLSLTMPLKRVALDVATEVTPDTAAVGAANTLVRRGTGWLAANTDVAGIEQALRAVGVTSVDRAVIVGAGGTAQAALAALRRLGESDADGAGPRPARAGALRDTAERLGVAPGSSAGSRTSPARRGRRDLHGACGRRGRAERRGVGPGDRAPRRHLRAVADRPGRRRDRGGLPRRGRPRGAAAPGRRPGGADDRAYRAPRRRWRRR